MESNSDLFIASDASVSPNKPSHSTAALSMVDSIFLSRSQLPDRRGRARALISRFSDSNLARKWRARAASTSQAPTLATLLCSTRHEVRVTATTAATVCLLPTSTIRTFDS